MRRSTVVMLVLLVMLAGLYWYMQQPNNVIQRNLSGTPTATTEDFGYVVRPDLGTANRITIDQAGAKSLVLDKTTGVWLLTTAAGSVPAAPQASDAAANDLLSLRILTKLNPAPDVAATGLDKPAFTISAVLANGVTVQFKVGKKTVTQSGYYVELQDGSVVVASANGVDSLTTLVDAPPYLQTPTPSPVPATATLVPTETPVPSATPETPTPTPTP